MPEEKIFIIPLRKIYEGTRNLRAKRGIQLVKSFLKKHMKTEKIKIGKSINEEIWKYGMQKPPKFLRIHVLKDNDVVYSEMLGVEIKIPSKEEIKKKEENKKLKKEKIKEERKERRQESIEDKLKAEEGQKKKESEK
ncbi:MAG: 50S ribosomal protein L31e [Candidatus Aenigmatarchaeota archaeon]|nr:60S ribosomal protein L31 [Candidatus Aenigmarchaeota archaeon]